ncbi:MAG: molybdopterin-dependent oxidoreductase [Candidatus Zixiibacteriota bacterium]|nr:MAG: molybdopterin-dependent oxidoreductase [candidate division Zixibacteria bacterium]
MKKKNGAVTITMDNQTYQVAPGITILEAAQQNNIEIPTLCAHKDLTPYGGCRMCIVEVEGMRNLPTACTTPISDGMIIRTNTAQVQSVRMEILQLFLSEHTSSCLICEDKDRCREYMGTIRKVGVTTGCRYCSNDGQCELQDVVEKMEVKEIKYPIYYRNLRVEKEDPFYERNYNLCVLCGRCVRMCQEVRVAHVLAFNHRGRETVIGPAYGRTHIEAGCEFCGACVSVCPTGSLTEKARAYEGKPDREELTTCSFCGVGCQMRLLVKGDRIIGSLPADDAPVNGGQLCVKGRFCITELVSGPKRLLRPYRYFDGTEAEVTREAAIATAAEKLSDCAPDEFGMLVSPNCTNEDLYVAQKFARAVMNSHNVDTSARSYYGRGFNAYLDLMRKAAPLSAVREASVILCVGLDTRFGRSVVGVELRRAVRRGARIITINPREHNLTLIAEDWIQTIPGQKTEALHKLVELTGKGASGARKGPRGVSKELVHAAETLAKAESAVILVGSEFLQYDSSAEILESVRQLAQNTGAGVLPLPAQNNLYGSLMMGAYPELIPGGHAAASTKAYGALKKAWGLKGKTVSGGFNAASLGSGKKLKVLYLVGENCPVPAGEAADFIIYQNIYPPGERFHADLVLPAAAFTESDGTFINGEGRVQRVRRAVEPPGDALPDWQILCLIARKMGVEGFDFANVESIHREMAGLVDGFKSFKKPARKPQAYRSTVALDVPAGKLPPAGQVNQKYPFMLSASITEHSHRGFSLSDWVEGTKPLFAEERLSISPADARKARISDGDEVIVTSRGFERVWPARIRPEQAEGTLHVTLYQAQAVNPNPHPVKMRKKNV